jgi:hypothetical protein
VAGNLRNLFKTGKPESRLNFLLPGRLNLELPINEIKKISGMTSNPIQFELIIKAVKTGRESVKYSIK